MNRSELIPREAIAAFCRKWMVVRLEVFGSILREDFSPDSDIDFLVTFAPESHWSLFDLVTMETELSSIVGRKVDLISRRGFEHSQNQNRRDHILKSAETIYAS